MRIVRFEVLCITANWTAHFCNGSEADMARSNYDVRFTPNSGHPLAQSKCPLWATSGLMHRSKKAP